MPRALLLAFSNPSTPQQTQAFDRWYTDVHLPEFLRVPGVISARRFELSAHQLRPAPDAALDGRRFIAAYEIEADDVAGVVAAIRSTAGERTPSDLLERDPPPLTLLFEQLGDRQAEGDG